jgi:hypothetical protein
MYGQSSVASRVWPVRGIGVASRHSRIVCSNAGSAAKRALMAAWSPHTNITPPQPYPLNGIRNASGSSPNTSLKAPAIRSAMYGFWASNVRVITPPSANSDFARRRLSTVYT